VFERDRHRCVSCGATTSLEYQHRQAVGMGGRKERPLYVDGLTSCARCNAGYEGDLQRAALRFGWKVRRWVEFPGMVPVWYPLERSWWKLALTGVRVQLTPTEAMECMREVYGDEYVPGLGLAA
jgi:hypothetical protein